MTKSVFIDGAVAGKTANCGRQYPSVWSMRFNSKTSAPSMREKVR